MLVLGDSDGEILGDILVEGLSLGDIEAPYCNTPQPTPPSSAPILPIQLSKTEASAGISSAVCICHNEVVETTASSETSNKYGSFANIGVHVSVAQT